ncbi:hypothetical protein [Streptomyces sp. NPDC029554]|uniref:hypothetical protein n=1 Tax=Streptomyces sp. NPDC029554 TaxID=3155126 RepID=UPI0033E54DE6
MGVFARILRRSKATEEAPAAEAGSDATKAGSETEEAATAEAKAAEGAADTAEPTAEATQSGESAEGEGVDIPKQQSTDKAADNEAGEGART